MAVALAMREEGREPDLLDRLAADDRLPLDRAQLEEALADKKAFIGATEQRGGRCGGRRPADHRRIPGGRGLYPGPDPVAAHSVGRRPGLLARAVGVPEIPVGQGRVADQPFEGDPSGKPPSRVRSHTCVPSTSMWKTPPVPGTSVTDPSSAPKVLSSSLAIHDARSSQLHWVQ